MEMVWTLKGIIYIVYQINIKPLSSNETTTKEHNNIPSQLENDNSLARNKLGRDSGIVLIAERSSI